MTCPGPIPYRLQGTGVRLEDDVVVVKDGPAEVLNNNCPDTIEEVTSVMATGNS